MISHNKKSKVESLKSKVETQAGVTLLLSLLILGAITAIAFSLATIMFIEIRSSSDLQRSEPGLFVTQGILEEAIFKTKRIVGDSIIDPYTNPVTTQCSGTNPIPLSCQFNGVKAEITINAAETTGRTNETILPTSTSYTTTPNVHYLVDAVNPYLDSNGDNSPDGGYGRIKITNVGQPPPASHADIHVGMCVLDDTDCVGPPTAWDFEQALTPGTLVTWTPLDPLKSYQLNIKNDTAGLTGFVKIETFGPGPTFTPKGLPYFGKRSIDVTATYLGLTRKYRALVPTQ